jgi:transcription initiation factor IIE alpha subunit
MDENTLLEGSISCPKCGEELEFDYSDLDDSDDDSSDSDDDEDKE